jgi:hypothetical protein
MADSGMDLAKLAQSLPAIMAMISQGQTPAGSGGYAPRSGTFADGMPSWFSFGSTLSQLGSMPALAGPGMDVFLQTQLPDLMSRLQANSGVSAIQQQQQRMARSAMMEMNFRGTGNAIAKGMGMDPSSGIGAGVAQMAPMLTMMFPELQQFAYATAPTAMFTGGKNVAEALQMMNPMSDIKPGQASAMREAMYRLGTKGDFMNSVFTHGANMDELAVSMEFAADMGDSANDLDVGALRTKHRERLRKERFKDRTSLTDAETRDLDADTTSAVLAERQTTAGGYNLQVAQAVKQFMGPGTSAGEAFQFMRENNMSAQSKGEADSLEETIRQLEALGKQAGMTTQDMMNAGRVMTAQSGGSSLYNTLAAGQANAAERAMTLDARDKGLDTNAVMANVVKDRLMHADIQQQNGTMAKAAAAIYATSAAGRERLVNDIETGNLADYNKSLMDVIYSRTDEGRLAATAINMGRDEQAAYEDEMTRRTGGKNLQMNHRLRMQVALDRLGALDSTLGGLLGDSKFQQAYAEGTQRGDTLETIAKPFGVSGSQLQVLSNYLRRDNMGQTLGTAMIANYQDERLQADRDFRARNTKAVADVENIAKSQGAGQGLFQNFRHKNITGIESALEAAGIVQPEAVQAIQAAFGKMTGPDRDKASKDLVNSMKSKQEALDQLSNGGLDEEGKQRAEAKLAQAQDRLDDLGLKELGRNEDSKQTLAWIADAKKADAAKQQEIGGVAPPGKSGETPPTAPGATSSAGSTTTVNGEIRIVVVDQQGTPLPDGRYTLDAVKNSGNINLVKGQGGSK